MGIMAKIIGPGGRTRPGSARSADVPSKYRCVQINSGEDACCQAVREIAGRRFLPEEIPRIPLELCDAAECRCSYELFEDRRIAPRNGRD